MSETKPLHVLSTVLADLTEVAAASVVGVHSHRALSSGFAWRPGLIVTADEVLAEEGNLAAPAPAFPAAAPIAAPVAPPSAVPMVALPTTAWVPGCPGWR